MKRFILLYFLTAVVLAAVADDDIGPLPKTTAAHFCQLLVSDNKGTVTSLAVYIRQSPVTDNHSPLTLEQQFATYVFHYDGWQTLRIFPHQGASGTTTWYAAGDALPADMDAEHQKYIHDVFPRLLKEVQAGNWSTVDAYIDRLLQYQATFGQQTTTVNQPRAYIIFIIGLLFALFLMTAFLSRNYQFFRR